jgi:hypothetical protein
MQDDVETVENWGRGFADPPLMSDTQQIQAVVASDP